MYVGYMRLIPLYTIVLKSIPNCDYAPVFCRDSINLGAVGVKVADNAFLVRTFFCTIVYSSFKFH